MFHFTIIVSDEITYSGYDYKEALIAYSIGVLIYGQAFAIKTYVDPNPLPETTINAFHNSGVPDIV